MNVGPPKMKKNTNHTKAKIKKQITMLIQAQNLHNLVKVVSSFSIFKFSLIILIL